MKRFIICFFIGLVSFPSLLLSQESLSTSRWTMVYEHDSLGNVMRGSKSALLQAVRGGSQLRVGYQFAFRDTIVEHIFPAGHFTVFKGELFAQLLPMTSQRWNHPVLTIWFGEKPFTYYALCSTNGQCDEMAVEWESGKKLMHFQIRRGLRWFAEGP